MRIYTVTKDGQPLAVVRAADPADAVETAVAMTAVGPAAALEVRDPNDAEMVGWLERRADYAVAEPAAAG